MTVAASRTFSAKVELSDPFLGVGAAVTSLRLLPMPLFVVGYRRTFDTPDCVAIGCFSLVFELSDLESSWRPRNL